MQRSEAKKETKTIDAKSATKKIPAAKADKNFYVIGIGASAGGLEALKKFFDNVPPGIKHSFVVIQHLSADFKNGDGHLMLCISDDGVGFDVNHIGKKKTLGLVSIRERVLMMKGEHKIFSIPEEGTTLMLSVPLN